MSLCRLTILQIEWLRRMGCWRTFSSVSDYASSNELPILTTPQKMIDRLDKIKDRKEKERKSRKPKRRGPLVISCQRKDYNFHRHEKFDKKSDFHKLVSCGWKNRKRNGDQFTLVSYGENPSLQYKDFVEFQDLGLSQEICDRLHHLDYQIPTQIQKLAIPSILAGEHTMCAAETGSGKTLAYLLPLIEKISHHKKIIDTPPDSVLGNPHSVVLSPNRELTEQVMNVTLSLTSSTDIKSHCVTGGKMKRSELIKVRDYPMDLLITTPGALNKMLDTKSLKRSNLQSIIIDEADTLLDDSFIEDIHHIFHRLQVSVSEGSAEPNAPFIGGIQLTLVSATMPRDLNNAVGHIIPIDMMTKVTTRGLHHLMPHVPQTFHSINPDCKPEKLIQLLKTSLEKRQVCIVFVKSSQTSFYLKRLLRENELDCLIMNGELSAKEREGLFSHFKEGYSDILVATDIASRGLDTTHVHHVINYDFPSFLSDYVHRVGRVGRVGCDHAGCVTSFVSHPWEVDLLWKIETAARMGVKLENMNANIKRKLESRHSESDVFSISQSS